MAFADVATPPFQTFNAANSSLILSRISVTCACVGGFEIVVDSGATPLGLHARDSTFPSVS
jgi:hypothetical protein